MRVRDACMQKRNAAAAAAAVRAQPWPPLYLVLPPRPGGFRSGHRHGRVGHGQGAGHGAGAAFRNAGQLFLVCVFLGGEREFFESGLESPRHPSAAPLVRVNSSEAVSEARA